MISRRTALKLGTAGFLLPNLGLMGTAFAGEATTESQSSTRHVPMFRGNAARTGEMPGPGLRLDTPVILKWSYEIEEVGSLTTLDGPVFLDDRIYISQEESVRCVDANSGEELWRFQSPYQELLDRAPAAADGIVYVGGVGLYALDAATGQELWRFEHGENRFDFHPLVDNGMLFVGGTGRIWGDPHFHALDAKTGTEKWRSSAFGSGSTESFAPALADGTVFMSASTSDLVALDAETGQEMWRFSPVFEPGQPPNSLAVADGTVYLACSDGSLFAINADTGKEMWRYTADGQINGAITVSHGAVLAVIGRKAIVAIDTASGEQRWRFEHDGAVLAGCALIDGLVFTQSYGESVLAIDLETGALAQEIPANGLDMGGSVSNLITIDGVVYGGWRRWVFALANLPAATLIADTTLRAAPSDSGVEIATLPAGAQITPTGNQEERDGAIWLEVSTDDASGWIVQDAIDPATLPPDDVVILYQP